MSDEISCSDPFILHLSARHTPNCPLHIPDRHDARQEVAHLDSAISLRIEEIQSISLFVDVDRIPTRQLDHREAFSNSLVRIMLQDQLFQPQESTFVRNLLPDLDGSFPGVLRC